MKLKARLETIPLDEADLMDNLSWSHDTWQDNKVIKIGKDKKIKNLKA